jgi:hypothetical protein
MNRAGKSHTARLALAALAAAGIGARLRVIRGDGTAEDHVVSEHGITITKALLDECFIITMDESSTRLSPAMSAPCLSQQPRREAQWKRERRGRR